VALNVRQKTTALVNESCPPTSKSRTGLPRLIGALCSLIVWALFFYCSRSYRAFPSGDFAIAAGASIFATLFQIGLFTFTEWLVTGFRWPYWTHFAVAASLLLALVIALSLGDFPREDAHPIRDIVQFWSSLLLMCLPYALPASITYCLTKQSTPTALRSGR